MNGGRSGDRSGSPAAPAVRVFISYRRDDSAGHAGHLYADLVTRFGNQNVFIDVDVIKPGEDFVDVIDRVLAEADVVIAVIGRSWLTSTDKQGHRRLDDPGDFVRLELETALTTDRKLIPVLVHDAVMPSADDLPPSLAPLTRRNAFDISDRRWPSDMADLIRAIEGVGEHRRPTGAAPAADEASLPHLTKSFLGRDDALASCSELLRAPETRLLTLTGPGGMGKTSLAVALAHQAQPAFDRIYWVDLTPCRTPSAVVAFVAESVGIRSTGDTPVLILLSAAVADQRALFVLDNFEHLVDGAGELSNLLHACASATVLTTSRQPLRLRVEHEYRIPGLALPAEGTASLDDARQYAGIALFLERARAAAPEVVLTDADTPDVVAICRQLDGIPLGIELAAARIRALAPSDLRARLRLHLSTLGRSPRDAPDRQRTLDATIDWSYQLLDEEERWFLRALSVFESSWTVDDLETVFDSEDIDVLDAVSSLIDKSLLVPVPDSGTRRYRLLQPVKQFAGARLREVPHEARVAHLHHRRWLLEAVSSEALDERRTAVHDDLQSAVKWSLEEGDTGEAATLAAGMIPSWRRRGQLREAAAETRAVLDTAEKAGSAALTELVLFLAELEVVLGNYAEAGSLYERAKGHAQDVRPWQGDAALLRRRGAYAEALDVIDEGAERLSRDDDPRGLWLERAWTLLTIGRVREARDVLLQALSDRHDRKDAIHVDLLCRLARAESLAGDPARAVAHAEEAIGLAEELGEDLRRVTALRLAGSLYQSLGRADAASAALQDGLALATRLGQVEEMGGCLINLGILEADLGHFEEAIDYNRRAIEIFCRIGHGSGQAIGYANLAEWLLAVGRTDEALASVTRARQLATALGNELSLANSLEIEASIHRDLGDARRSARQFRDAGKLYRELGVPEAAARCWAQAESLEAAEARA